jgi:hypothetical protein
MEYQAKHLKVLERAGLISRGRLDALLDELKTRQKKRGRKKR